MSRPLFTMWPKRAHDLFRKHEFSADDAWMMIVIVGEADHVTREAIFDSLGALRSKLGWDRDRRATAQHVRNRLNRLRERGEIAFEIQRGQRVPIVISVEKADYFQRDPPPALDVTSNGTNKESVHGSNRRGFEPPQRPTFDVPPLQTRPDVDVYEDQNREGAALVDKSLDTEQSDVARSRAAELVALLPASSVAGNTLTVITRYVRELPPAEVDEVEASYLNAAAIGEIRDHAAWLIGTLKKRAIKVCSEMSDAQLRTFKPPHRPA